LNSSTSLLGLIFLAQQIINCFQTCSPESLLIGNPFLDSQKRIGAESQDVLPADSSALDELRAFQKLDVLGYGIERDLEGRCQVGHPRFGPRETTEDLATGWICECDQRVVESLISSRS
jgi:hypothetical protein